MHVTPPAKVPPVLPHRPGSWESLVSELVPRVGLSEPKHSTVGAVSWGRQQQPPPAAPHAGLSQALGTPGGVSECPPSLGTAPALPVTGSLVPAPLWTRA